MRLGPCIILCTLFLSTPRAAAAPANIADPPVALAESDDSTGAPSGPSQLPNLLLHYAKRPPWKVAGVDYAVGVPSGRSLRGSDAISEVGTAVDETHHFIRVIGDNVKLDGYDFLASQRMGCLCRPGSARQAVIGNSNFRVGANNVIPIRRKLDAGGSHGRALHF